MLSHTTRSTPARASSVAMTSESVKTTKFWLALLPRVLLRSRGFSSARKEDLNDPTPSCSLSQPLPYPRRLKQATSLLTFSPSFHLLSVASSVRSLGITVLAVLAASAVGAAVQHTMTHPVRPLLTASIVKALTLHSLENALGGRRNTRFSVFE